MDGNSKTLVVSIVRVNLLLKPYKQKHFLIFQMTHKYEQGVN